MRPVVRLLLLILAAAIAGCASTDHKDDDRVSSIPWAKPEGWQSQGGFGGMMQGSR